MQFFAGWGRKGTLGGVKWYFLSGGVVEPFLSFQEGGDLASQVVWGGRTPLTPRIDHTDLAPLEWISSYMMQREMFGIL